MRACCLSPYPFECPALYVACVTSRCYLTRHRASLPTPFWILLPTGQMLLVRVVCRGFELCANTISRIPNTMTDDRPGHAVVESQRDIYEIQLLLAKRDVACLVAAHRDGYSREIFPADFICAIKHRVSSETQLVTEKTVNLTVCRI